MYKHTGEVVDQFGGEIDVWLNRETGHVVLRNNDTQVGDFWLGQPCQEDELQVLADRVARGEAKRLSVMTPSDADQVRRERRAKRQLKQLQAWPGDGRVH